MNARLLWCRVICLVGVWLASSVSLVKEQTCGDGVRETDGDVRVVFLKFGLTSEGFALS